MPAAQAIASAWARRYFKEPLDQRNFMRQMGDEAHFQDLTSPAGAQGYAQLMPGTARAWGVSNPHDPNQAYRAAAEHMAAYLRAYNGDWSKALTAYNAGPGAVGKPLPAETRRYISTILGGQGNVSSAAGGSAAAALPSSTVNLGLKSSFDQQGFARAQKLSFLASYLQRNHAEGSLFRTGVLSTAAPDPQDFTSSQLTSSISRTPAAPGATPQMPAGHSGLLELFWQGHNGINVKNGQVEPQGFVSGHTDHVHVAAGPNTIISLGKLAQQMGLHVGENPHFGGVHPVHVNGSYHYKGEAIDVSGDPALMAAYAHRVARMFRAR
jgi:hypothetical protein